MSPMRTFMSGPVPPLFLALVHHWSVMPLVRGSLMTSPTTRPGRVGGPSCVVVGPPSHRCVVRPFAILTATFVFGPSRVVVRPPSHRRVVRPFAILTTASVVGRGEGQNRSPRANPNSCVELVSCPLPRRRRFVLAPSLTRLRPRRLRLLFRSPSAPGLVDRLLVRRLLLVPAPPLPLLHPSRSGPVDRPLRRRRHLVLALQLPRCLRPSCSGPVDCPLLRHQRFVAAAPLPRLHLTTSRLHHLVTPVSLRRSLDWSLCKRRTQLPLLLFKLSRVPSSLLMFVSVVSLRPICQRRRHWRCLKPRWRSSMASWVILLILSRRALSLLLRGLRANFVSSLPIREAGG